MKIIFSQLILLKDHESCIYQINRKQETYSELLFNLGLFKLLSFHNQKSSLLFSLISKFFKWVGTFKIPMGVFWDGRKYQRKFFSFFLLYVSQNFLFFSLPLFFPKTSSQEYNQNDYLLKPSHMKRKNPNKVIGLLWKACWVKIF